MTSELYKIVYCSKNYIEGAPGDRDSEILQILSTARANNGRQAVTGALLFNSGYFAQVLEGPQAAIERLFEKIQRDSRHGEVTVLESGKAKARSFPDWSMAHALPPSDAEASGVAAALDLAILHPETSGHEVLDLLRSLVLQDD